MIRTMRCTNLLYQRLVTKALIFLKDSINQALREMLGGEGGILSPSPGHVENRINLSDFRTTRLVVCTDQVYLNSHFLAKRGGGGTPLL
jgi:hypothetical protein